MKRDRMFVNGLMRLVAYAFISLSATAQFVAPGSELEARDTHGKATGDTFNPSNPPRSGTSVREA